MPRVKNVPIFDEYGWMQGDKIALTESISMGLAENNMQDKKPKERRRIILAKDIMSLQTLMLRVWWWFRMTETKNNLDVVNGVKLLNTCTNCGDKFKPSYGMTNEPLCDSCLGKAKHG